ncbi:MAG: hypothetical protein ACI4DN_00445 [Lachnospiraceae bacterium]
MEILGYIILAGFVTAAAAVFFIKKKKPSEDRLKKQQLAYEELLKKYNVPEKHYKIVIGQSRVYSVYNCPAVIWKEGDKVKTLVLRLKPVLAQEDVEDFLFLSSQPQVDFRRFDGSDFPDWAIQSDYVKELFLPCANVSKTVGGIDYKKQMYWLGTLCVYANSLSGLLTMLERPLSDYDNRVENKALMLKDGSLPDSMKEELKKELEPSLRGEVRESASNLQSLQGMERAIQTIRDAEHRAGEKEAEDRINRLYAKLLSEKRYEDLEKATLDENYRKALFQEFKEE